MTAVIGPGSWVRLHYELRDGRGNLIDKTDEPVEFAFGHSSLLPGLESALEGTSAGDVFQVTFPPEEAYGTRDESNVFQVPRDEFPEDATLEEGAEFEAEGEDGAVMHMNVLVVHDDHVLVDANHPLAGETLNFSVRVLEVRAATEDELLAARMETSDLQPPEGEPS